MIRNNNVIPERDNFIKILSESTDKRKTTELSLKVPFCNDRQFPSVFARVSKSNFSTNCIRQATVIVPLYDNISYARLSIPATVFGIHE